MTFLELCQRLRQEAGAAGGGPAAVTGQNGEYARLVDWVRTAWREIQLEQRHWRFAWKQAAIEVEPDFLMYPLPDDFDCWDAATLRFGDTPLRAMPWETFRERYREPHGTLQVVSVAPDDTLRLNAHPEAGQITFEYWRLPQELANNGDVPRLPPRYHMAIVYRALMQYGLYENAPEVVQQADANYRQMMNRVAHSELPSIAMEGPLA